VCRSETKKDGAGRVERIELARLDSRHATHELGHALGADDLPAGPECPGNVRQPVMCAAAGDRIRDSDLDLVCSAGECTAYNPEWTP
jgi:hypothetical protein